MSGSPSAFILPGRHQPPHFDHLRLIACALEQIPDELNVGLIVSPALEGEPDTQFEREAREHHAPDRAPFGFALRRRMLELALSESLSAADFARVRILPLPRPEVSFELVQAIFPDPRVWIIPEVGEAFDEMKARFFLDRGDQVLRLRLRCEISGRTVRDLIEAEAWKQLETYAPLSVIQLIREERARRSLI